MTKEPVLHIAVTVMFLMLTVVLGLVPDPVARIASMFMPILLFVLLTSILCGPFYAAFLGVVGPLLLGTVFPETLFLRAVAPDLFFYLASGIVTGVLYSLLKTSVGSVIGGVLSALFVFGLARIVSQLFAGSSYYLIDYFEEAIRHPAPGLILSLVAVPLLILVFRKHNIMRVMRNERQSN